MKRLLLCIACILCVSTSVFAQYSLRKQPQVYNDGIPVVDARVYPLGILAAGATAFDSLNALFTNAYTYFNWRSGDQPGDTLYGIQGGGFLEEYKYYKERRNYFFSGYIRPNDRTFDYATYGGAFHREVGDTTSGEYKIEPADAPLGELNSESAPSFGGGYKGNYLLREPVRDLYTAFHEFQNPDPAFADTFYYDHYADFIYRLDTSSSVYQNTSPDQDTLFFVEVWIKGAKKESLFTTNERWLKYDSIAIFPITKEIYWAAMSPDVDTQWWEGDLEEHLRMSPIIPRKAYTRLHIAFSDSMMRHYFFDGQTATDTLGSLRSRYKSGEFLGFDDTTQHRNKVRFDVRLRRHPTLKVPIYVKGLRMRDGGAERLLTGQFDTQLDSQFTWISQSKYLRNGQVEQGSYYPNLINIQIEEEPESFRYYIIGYIDRFARDNGFKRITSITPFDPRETRLIWDDILWKPTMTDAAPDHLYRNINYSTVYERHPMAALPIDVLPKSIIDTATGQVFDTVRMFTQRVWPRTDHTGFELSHDTIFAQQFRTPLRDLQQAAFFLGSKPIPFWVMGQAYIGYCTVDTTNWSEFERVKGEKPKKDTASIREYLLPFIGDIQNTPGAPIDSLSRIVLDGTMLYDTSKLGYNRTHLSAEQIRLQANVSAAWGAKGFLLMNAGSDGLNCIGLNTLNFNHDPDSVKFAYERDAELPAPGVPLVQDWFDIGPESLTMYTVTDTCDWTYFDTPNPSLTLINCQRYNMCGGQKTKIYPRHHDGPVIYNSCNTGWTLWASLPTFYGFKTRYSGIKKAFGDLNNAAEKLKRLDWVSAVDISGRDTTSSDTSFLPVKDVESVIQHRIHVSGTGTPVYTDSLADSSNSRLVEMGVFIDPIDTSARYIYVVNRRTWPNRPLADTLTDSTYLGNVAVRNIRFRIRPDILTTDTSQHFWLITDWARKKDSVLHTDSVYGVLLEPGEGRLLRVAPTRSLALGTMTENIFNNGRHIAAVETASTITRYLTTYMRDGNIVVSYPVETPTTVTKRSAPTPIDSVIDASGNCYYPAIAYNTNNTSIGLVYQKRIPVFDPNSPQDSVLILYRRATVSSDYAFSAPVLIDSFLVGRPWDLETGASYTAPPAIAPNDFSTGTNREFWIAYNHPDSGGRVVMVNTNLSKSNYRSFYKQFPSHLDRVSIATHFSTDTAYIAFQESFFDETRIYALKAWRNGGIVNVTPNANIQWISQQSCTAMNPQIATDIRGSIVTWESKGRYCRFLACPEKIAWHDVYLRRYSRTSGLWGTFTKFRIHRDTSFIPDSVYQDFYAYPNIAINDEATVQNPNLEWYDQLRLMWSYPEHSVSPLEMRGRNKVGFARFGGTDWGASDWSFMEMTEPSVEPALPTVSLNNATISHAVLYRYPLSDTNNARITRYDFPKVGVAPRKVEMKTLIAKVATLCSGMNARIDSIAVKKGGGPPVDDVVPFVTLVDSVSDPSIDTPVTWNDSRVRTHVFALTAADTLQYRRHLWVGNYEAGDTVGLSSLLANLSDYVSMYVYLRSSYNDSIISILDTARLYQPNGFVSSAGVLGGGWRKFVPASGFSDSVYITIEAARGDGANTFYLLDIDSYNDDLFDAYPDSPAFKRATPLPTASTQENAFLNVTVNPNPFSGSTTINVETQKGLPFVIEVYDLLGKRLGTVYNGISEQEKGWFTLGREMLTPGSYFVRVQAGSQVVTRKIELVK